MEKSELLEECRHECRNAVTSIQHDVKRLAEAEAQMSEIQNLVRRAIINIAHEQSRIEAAINFLNGLEKKMNRAQRNNNPVNLKFAGQNEAIGQDSDGFAIFPTPMAGWRAAHAQIKLDQVRGLTLKQFIFKFAPPEENNTNAYLEFVMDHLQIEDDPNPTPDTKLFDISKYSLAGVMAQMEGYYKEEL